MSFIFYSDDNASHKEDTPSEGHGWRIRQAFGANVRRVRQQQGLTKHALARMSGISRQLVARIEDGAADVRLSFVQKIADALRVSPAELLDEADDWDA